MKAITIRQPWAWAVIHAGKNIENRDWKPYEDYRGLLLIHAGLSKDDLVSGTNWITRHTDIEVPTPEELVFGAIIGAVDLTDCLFNNRRQQREVWGQRESWYHWELSNPRPFLQPIKCSGKHKLWTPSAETIAASWRQLGLTVSI
jgi:hypothetical protein